MKKIISKYEKTWFVKTIKAAFRDGKVKGRKKLVLLFNGGEDEYGNLFYVDWSDTHYVIGSKCPDWVNDGVILECGSYGGYDGNEKNLTAFAHYLINKYNDAVSNGWKYA